ncbi:MAG: hypothetical protein AAGE03_02385 [Pseudomonadota bacterium]
MTPQIALDLSLDGIAVLSRVPEDHPQAGKWWREGTVRLDAPDLPGALARLREKAEARAGADFTSILILPDSQLLYTSLERDDRRPKETIRSLLRGRTPYEVDDLTFDFIQRGDRLLVAVVALETLLEAETFAADHGFRPIAVVANPDRAIYPGLPDLGATGIALELTGGVPVTLALDNGFQLIPAPPLPKAPEPPVVEPPSVTPENAAQFDPTTEPPAEDRAQVACATGSEKDAPASEDHPAAAPITPPEAPPADTKVPAAEKQPPTAPASVSAPAAAAKSPTARAEPSFSTQRHGAPAPGLSAERIAPSRIKPRLTAAPPPPPRAVAPDEPLIGKPTAPPKASSTDASPSKPVAAPPAPSDGLAAGKPLGTAPEPPTSTIPVEAPLKTATPSEAAPSPSPAAMAPDGGLRERAARAARLSPLLAIKDADAPQTDSPAKPDRLANSKAQAPQSRIAALIARRPAESDPEVEAARQEEAQALTLPGLAREMAAQPSGPRIGTGLVLTLVLLAGLMGVGLWSMLGAGRDAPLDQVASTDRAIEPPTEAEALLRDPDVVIAPEPEAETAELPQIVPDTPSTAGPDIATAEPLPDAAAQSDATTDAPDLAALLPSSTDTQDNPTGAPTESLVTPPVPLPGPIPDEIAGTAEEPEATERIDDAPLEQFSAQGADEPAPTQPDTPAEPAAPAIVVAQGDPALANSETTALPRAVPPADSFARLTTPAPVPTDAEPLEAPTPEAEEATEGSVADNAVAEADSTTEPETDTGIELVAATTDGALAPGGYRVILGRPDLMPTRRPVDVTPIQTAFSPQEIARREVLSRVRPVPRPADLAPPEPDPEVEIDTEASAAPETETPPVIDDGLDAEARAILSRTRPQPRPPEVEAAAEEAARRAAEAEAEAARIAAEAAAAVEAARLAAEAEADAAVQAASQAAAASLASTAEIAAAQGGPVSPLAIAQAERPRLRPRSVEREAARVIERRREQASAAPAAPAARQADSGRQQVRSAGGDVARAATERNVIRLNQVNLIGTYGRPSARRALVRLSNGRYVKVEVGDRLDRGRVTAIGESELSYQRGNRNIVLRLPRA